VTTPIIPQTTYPQYGRQYVDPSATKLEELMRRFAVPSVSAGATAAPAVPAASVEPTAGRVPPWIMSYGHREPTTPVVPHPTVSQGDYSARGWAGRMTRGSGQVRPAEMSSYDLLAEANELGIAGTMVMPRPVLEKAVETMRKQRQSQQTPGLSPELRRTAGVAVGALESGANLVENFFGETPGLHGVRGMLGTLKAKLRLSTTEQQAADQDRAMAVGTFVGPFIPQYGLFKGIEALGAAATTLPKVGGVATKLFTGWRGGAVSAGVMNVVWNSQYKDMPLLPDADMWAAGAAGLQGDALVEKAVGAAQIAGATLNSRVGSLLFDVGLGAVFGRWQQQGATALPQGAKPSAPPPTGGFGPQPAPVGPMGPALPPAIGPQGPLATSPLSLVNTADGQIGPLWRPPAAAVEVQEDLFGWKPTAPDVAPRNMASTPAPEPMPQVRSTPTGQTTLDFGTAETPIVQPKAARLTAKEMAEQFESGSTTWPEAVPVPAAGENDFPNWQNLPAARLARASGTVLAKEDGSLIALFHESGGPVEGEFRLSGPNNLTSTGLYLRDRADVPYAEFSEKVGYGVQRAADNKVEYERISELATGLREQIDNMESAFKQAKKAPAEGVARVAELRSQLVEYETRMSELLPQSAPTTHPVFAVVQKPYYYDSPISQDRVEEILNVIRTNDTFESLRASLTQTEGEFYELFKHQYNGKPVEPLGSQVHQMLSNLWQETPDGIKTLYETAQVNQVLQAAGYDAIHNIGGVRSTLARESGMQYNAWNLLDPERQLIRVFATPPMAADLAEQTATQLTKQAAVAESPVLIDAAEKMALSEADVVVANIATHPYGVQVVRGVKEPGTLMQQLSSNSIGVDGVGPTGARLIPRDLTPGGVQTYDVMISTGKPIDDKMVSDYRTYGVFEGMHGVNEKGKGIEVLKVFTADGAEKSGAATLKKGKVYLVTRRLDIPTVAKPDGLSARTNVTSIDKFLERRVSQTPDHAQDPAIGGLVREFMTYASTKLGLDPEDLLSVDAMQRMPKLFQEYAAAKKLPAGAQYSVGQLVDEEMRLMARELMGDEFKAVDDAIAEAVDAVPTDRIDDVQQSAIVRGLTATREPGTPGWVLKGPNATRWVVTDDEAALAFLRRYDATVPDLSPGAPLMPDVARSGMPDTHFTMPPSIDEMLAGAEGSETLAKAGIDAAKLEQNLLRDELGGRFGVTAGPAQPASAPPPLPPTPGAPALPASPLPRPAGVMRGQPPLPPPPPPVAVGGGAAGAPVPPGPPGGLAGLAPQLQAVARNVMSIERELTSFSMQHVLPSSYFFDRMEELLFKAGGPSLRPGQQMEKMRELISTFYNDSEPHIAKLTKLMNRVSSDTRRKGKVWRALDLPLQPTQNQPVSRAAYMQREGFTAAERQVVDETEQMLTDVYGGNKQLADRVWLQLKAYVNIVEQNIVAGSPNPYRVPQGTFTDITHFIEHAERRQLRLEVPETGNIMYEYLRSYYWSQNVKPSWDQMQAGWRAISRWQDARGERVLRPVAEHVLTWMNGVENGFMPKNDPVVNALQSALGMFGIPLNKAETMQMISGTMSSAYRALLGWNPASTIRDSLQFLGAAPWTGFDNLRESMFEVVGRRGQAARNAVWQRALQEGWTELGIPPHPGTNVHQSAMLPGAPPLQSGFTPAEEARRELAQNVTDFFRDMTPVGLRSIEGTKLDPLWAYTQQGVVLRIVVANAATKRFDQVMAKPQTIASAMRSIGADVLSFAQRRNIEEALVAGQTSEARKIYTNTVANTVMNRYGLKEGAVGNHTVTGRLFSQLGGHSSHQLASMLNLAKGGFTGTNVGEKAVNFVTGKASPTLYRMTAMMGMLGGALYTIQQQTGWNMMKMHPLNWAANPQMLGGPLKEPALNVVEALNQAPGMLMADNPSYRQREALRSLTELPGSFLKMAGAPAAAFRLASGVAKATGDNTPESLARYLVTGDRRPQAAVNAKQANDNLLSYLEGRSGTGAR